MQLVKHWKKICIHKTHPKGILCKKLLNYNYHDLRNADNEKCIYWVSENGNVWHGNLVINLKQSKTRQGYLKLGLKTRDSENLTVNAHKIVASFWYTPESIDYNVLDHINRYKDDTRSSNLQWATLSKNALNQSK